jgi:glycosyltransferase involved in cell wall biosynthesis
MTRSTSPIATILVEWENVLRAEASRAARMLARVAADAARVEVPCEVLVAFDPARVDAAAANAFVAAHFRAPDSPADAPPPAAVRFFAAPGRRYYGLRNAAAADARGEWILCLDSDVVPEPGWLDAMCAAIRARPTAKIIGGATHLDPEGIVGKAFAAGWFFPLRSDDDALDDDVESFFANNVTFRREAFLASPYPEDPASGETRNACRRLAAAWRAAGTPIYRAGAARAAHPAPYGFGAVLVRGLAEGRDEAVAWERRGRGRLRRLLRACAFSANRLVRGCRRLVRERRRLSLRRHEAPLAAAVIGVYATCLFLGAFAQACLPRTRVPAWRI